VLGEECLLQAVGLRFSMAETSNLEKNIWILWEDPRISEVINPLTAIYTEAAFMNAAS
jgi:hypothetical protein